MKLPIDFRKLRDLIPCRRVLEDYYGWRPVMTRGCLSRGPCPFHGSAPRSRSLAVVSGQWYCHKCHTFGDSVDLLTRKYLQTAVEAAEELCEKYRVAVPRKPHR